MAQKSAQNPHRIRAPTRNASLIGDSGEILKRAIKDLGRVTMTGEIRAMQARVTREVAESRSRKKVLAVVK
jgi:hypothetical protein